MDSKQLTFILKDIQYITSIFAYCSLMNTKNRMKAQDIQHAMAILG